MKVEDAAKLRAQERKCKLIRKEIRRSELRILRLQTERSNAVAERSLLAKIVEQRNDHIELESIALDHLKDDSSAAACELEQMRDDIERADAKGGES